METEEDEDEMFSSPPGSWRADVDRIFLSKQIVGLNKGALPNLTSDVAVALRIPVEAMPNRVIRQVVARALDLAASTASREQEAAIAGARGFLLIQPAPDRAQLDAINAANHAEHRAASKVVRWSWAYYQQQRVLLGAKAAPAYEQRNGSRQRRVYRDALTAALRVVLDNPMHLRHLRVDEDDRLKVDSPRAQRLLDEVESFASDVVLPLRDYVPRTIEADLLTQVCDPTRILTRAVVGEAGYGKSTLLGSLYETIRDSTSLIPLLVSATWFQADGESHYTVDEFIGAVEDITQLGRRVVVLLDTADLLLHDEGSRRANHRLLASLDARGVAVVLTSRPREAELLPRDELREIELGPYDDRELPTAVAILAAKHSPQLSITETVAQVLGATARNLPVADVCRSPLLLRLLFELADGELPELREVDVTKLYEDYWQRRIVRDARTDRAITYDIDPDADLSTVTGLFGMVLLAAGTPELSDQILTDTASQALRSALGGQPANVEQTLQTLLQRGTLLRSGGRVRFFHQTMFEFATAKALAHLSGVASIRPLLERVVQHDGDLFVGAVLEQLLILIGSNPLAAQEATAAVRRLLESDNDSLHGIALVAWAHHPRLLATPELALPKTANSALSRAATIIPALASADLTQGLDQLALIWAHAQEGTRLEVIRALTRLAGRASVECADFARRHRIVEALLLEELTDEERATLSAFLHSIGPARPEQARQGLLRILTAAVRAETPPVAAVELTSIADAWSSLGHSSFLEAIEDTLQSVPHDAFEVADALGKLYAHQWRQERHIEDPAEEQDWIRFVISTVTPPRDSQASILTAGKLFGIGYLLTGLEESENEILLLTIIQLVSARSAQLADVVAGHVLPRILAGTGAAAEILAANLRARLSFVRGGALDDISTLRILASPEVPLARISEVLPGHLIEVTWRSSQAVRFHDYGSYSVARARNPDETHRPTDPLLQRLLQQDAAMLALLPAAAAAGNLAAQQARRVLLEAPAALDAFTQDEKESLLRHAMLQVHRDATLVPLIVTLAISLHRVDEVIQISNTPDLAPQLNGSRKALAEFARSLLAGPSQQQLAGARLVDALVGREHISLTWGELHGLLDSATQAAVRRSLIATIWKQEGQDETTLHKQIAYLGQYVEIQAGHSRPVHAVQSAPSKHETVLDACRLAWLRLLTLRGVPHPDQWPTVQTLALYAVDSMTPSTTGTELALTTSYLTHLADLGHPEAAHDCLLEFFKNLRNVEFAGRHLLLWRRETHAAIRRALTIDTRNTVRQLAELAPELDSSIAAEIVQILAEQQYVDARPALVALLREPISPELRGHLVLLLRARDRSMGASTFPEILTLLAAQ